MRRRLGNNLDGLKWVALGLLAFLRNHLWNASFQRGDLPIDMQHLRFQKRRAITSDNRSCLRRWNLQRSTLNAQRTTFNSESPRVGAGSPLPSQERRGG